MVAEHRLVHNAGCEASAEARVEELLSLPSVEGRCRHGGRPTYLQSVTAPARQRVAQFGCKSWGCRVCAYWLKRRAGNHYGVMILTAAGALLSQRVSEAEWDSRRRTLNNREANWVRVGELVIWCEPAPDGATAHTDTASAVRLLGDALRAIPCVPAKAGDRHRPVSSSHDWRLPAKERRYTQIGWVSVADPAAVVDRLRAAGVEPASIKTRLGATVKFWDVIFECHPDRREQVSAALACGAAGGVVSDLTS